MTLRDVIAQGGNVHPPAWLPDNLVYETMTGSVAYAVASDTSDVDVYGVCIPPKDLVFPHLAGEIHGFGQQLKRFDNWQQHHIKAGGKEWDFQVYGIVNFCHLVMMCSPNMVDALFTPQRCVLTMTAIGAYLREYRRDFLCKKAWHSFKGYAFQQLAKIRTKKPKEDSKRAASVAQHGYDVKPAYHVVRLMLEAEMILTEHDLDLERHAAQLRDIRAGNWTLQRVEDFFQDKERALESTYNESKLRYHPDESRIREHLLHCLEMHFGNLASAVTPVRDETALLQQIAELTKHFQR